MIGIKKVNTLDKESTQFLVTESFKLFCKSRGYNNLSEKKSKKLKTQLTKLYIKENLPTDNIYIAYQDDLIVGCAYITNTGYLREIFVKEEYQGQKIGSLLLEKIISDYIHITLNAYPNAVKFYRKHNFVITGREKGSLKMKHLS